MQENELKHMGVKGMRWGIRRYQDYGKGGYNPKNKGRYTEKAVAKFQESDAKYESASQRHKAAKENLRSVKRERASKAEISKAKSEIKDSAREKKAAKSEMQADYKNVKRENLADQGRELYKEGKRVKSTKGIKQAIIGAGYVAYFMNSYGKKKGGINLDFAVIGSAAVRMILRSKTESDNKKLRAYYSHNA